MKTIFTTIIVILFLSNVCIAQDTLYIYKGGEVVSMRAVADIDSIIFSKSGKHVNDIVFNPNLTYGSVTDIDNNTYKTIQIGSQTWMAENLKTTKYNDGTAIPLVTDESEWGALITPGYCWYNNDSATYNATYGTLYNWFTVDSTNNGSKNVCPIDWHIPTDAEWTVLTDTLGGYFVAGGKLKESGLAHWADPNQDATNETGFTALPSASRYYKGYFSTIGNDGTWWGTTEGSTGDAWICLIYYDYGSVSLGNYGKRDGFSVRCLRD